MAYFDEKVTEKVLRMKELILFGGRSQHKLKAFATRAQHCRQKIISNEESCFFPRTYVGIFGKFCAHVFLHHDLKINYKQDAWFLNNKICLLVKSCVKIWPQRFFSIFVFFSVCVGRHVKNHLQLVAKNWKILFSKTCPVLFNFSDECIHAKKSITALPSALPKK